MLRDVFPSLQMMVLTASLELLMFGQKAIRKHKTLVEEVETLQNMVSDEKAARQRVEKLLAQLESSFSASEALVAKRTKSD